MSIRTRITIFETIFLILLFSVLYQINKYQKELTKLSNERVSMLFAANRLRQSSDNLSKFARSYVATNNPKYKYRYFYTLDIRNGVVPRPKDYFGVYWSLSEKDRDLKHPPTKNLSLNQIFNSLPFTKKELDLLKKSHTQSDDLVDLEKEAFYLLRHHQQQKAIQIMFSDKYHHAKTKIMNPIDDFIIEVNNRMKHLVNVQNKKIHYYFIVFIILTIIFILTNIYLYFYVAKLNKIELKEKDNLIKTIASFNENLEKKVENRTEQIKKLMKVKSEFLANMSHEIRTPLNAMFGFIKILQEKQLDEESHKYLNIIEKSGKNLLAIINDILDFSKIEAGKLNIEKIEFNPQEEISMIHSLFQASSSQKNITLEINENLKYNIITDPTRLKQVLSNLLSNAIKFSKDGTKVILNINYNDKTERLYIEVIDKGIGIPQEKLKYIFDAFSQADSSTTREYGGTGLGLTISYTLIKLLGGELKVSSKEGEGSKFYFSIPAKKTTIITKKQIENKTPILDKTFDKHLLLVEDNKANQMFMKVILSKIGLSFDIANNGLEAIEQFKNNKYDFILMDENMPKMNGIEATKKIRKIEKENNLKHTIIIALTANAMEGDKERFINAGMDYYLSKPLDIDKFKTLLVTIFHS